MTVYLLDVNVLIALVDPAHIQHEPAHAWFGHVGRKSFAPDLLSSHSRVTDSYLLALAHANGGRLATMDMKLAAEVVPGGKKALELIPVD